MYSFPDTGIWYDAGFLLGLATWGGGGGAAAYHRGEDTEDELADAHNRIRPAAPARTPSEGGSPAARLQQLMRTAGMDPHLPYLSPWPRVTS